MYLVSHTFPKICISLRGLAVLFVRVKYNVREVSCMFISKWLCALIIFLFTYLRFLVLPDLLCHFLLACKQKHKLSCYCMTVYYLFRFTVLLVKLFRLSAGYFASKYNVVCFLLSVIHFYFKFFCSVMFVL
jgi:hypothetical protein